MMQHNPRPRCPLCKVVMYRVHTRRKYGPHYYCPKCGTVRGLVGGELVLTQVSELIAQTGVGPDGRPRQPVQAPIFGGTDESQA